MTLMARTLRIRRALGLMSWATADQVLFALSNFVITIAVARGMGVEGLGRFSVAFAAYLTVLGFSRSLISEPLLAQPRREGDRGVEAASVTLTLLGAAAGALVVGGAGLMLGRVELLVVAAALPVTLLHDILRYHAFRRKKAQFAALLDGGWLLGSVIAWPVVTGSESASVALLCWAGAALVGIGLGWRSLRPHLVAPRAAVTWWRHDARGLATPLLLDSILVTISLLAMVFVLASVAGDGALGLLRAGQVYFAPLGMVLTALGILAVPHLAQRSVPTTTGLAMRLSAGLAALACLACTAIIVAEPLLHAVLYADSIDVPGWLLVPLAAQVILSAGAGGLVVVCKARARGGDIARSRLSSTVIGLAVLVPATIAFGLQGAAWALVAGSLLYTADLGVRVVRAGTRWPGPTPARADTVLSDPKRLRVALVAGGLPADVRHLEAASRDVELTVYRSRWQPPHVTATASAPPGLRVRDFSPVIRSRRGHLTFVYRGLRQALADDSPDVIHVLSEPWGLLTVQTAAWVRAHPETRLVVHGCDTIWHHGGAAEQWLRRWLLRRTLPSTHAWVAESRKALALAARNGLPDDRMRARIHTNPRDGELFRPPAPAERARAQAALEVAPDSVAVGLLGRLVPEKGVRLFLDAADSLLRDGFPGQFFIAGDGPLGDEVRRRASPGLVALGKLSHPVGVLELFQALDVLACPSLTTSSWEDQGPRSLLEAMMCGCIPVGTPTGAIPEMLGGHGVLAESTEPRAVADAIAKAAAMSRDGARRTQLASWAHGLYSADAVASQLVDLWRAVAPQPAARPDRESVT